MLQLCLSKEAKRRVHDIADVRLAMDGAFETASEAPQSVAAAHRARPWAAAVFASLVTGLAVWSLIRSEPPEVTRFAYELPVNHQLRNTGRPVLAVSPDGRTSLSPHFARLARHWPAYGCPGSTAPGIDHPAPDDDGLWRLDLESGALDLIVSVADAAAVGDARPSPGAAHFITHPTFSPTGKNICYLQRYFTADVANYTRLIVCRPDGSGATVLAEEKVSHFDWLDDDRLVVWTRSLPPGIGAARRRGLLATPLLRPLVNLARKLRPGLKQMLLAEAYFLVDINQPSRKKAVGRGLLEQDGHPMFTADRRWMITDTYPDGERMQTLILYHFEENRRIDVGRFKSDPSVDESDIKCDLHPRWDRQERLVCIDSTDHGVRQCQIVDLSTLLDA